MNLIKLFKGLFKRSEPSYYTRVKIVSSLLDVPVNMSSYIFIVRNGDKDKWVVFQCPDNCGRRVEVNLMKSRYPYWQLKTKKGKISLRPSVVVEGCGAHFWVYNNNIEWARDDDEISS